METVDDIQAVWRSWMERSIDRKANVASRTWARCGCRGTGCDPSRGGGRKRLNLSKKGVQRKQPHHELGNGDYEDRQIFIHASLGNVRHMRIGRHGDMFSKGILAGGSHTVLRRD
jgi:hypothetical protein